MRVNNLIAVTFVLLKDKVSVKTGSNKGTDLTLFIFGTWPL